jgi:hypothetical protein
MIGASTRDCNKKDCQHHQEMHDHCAICQWNKDFTVPDNYEKEEPKVLTPQQIHIKLNEIFKADTFMNLDHIIELIKAGHQNGKLETWLDFKKYIKEAVDDNTHYALTATQIQEIIWRLKP